MSQAAAETPSALPTDEGTGTVPRSAVVLLSVLGVVALAFGIRAAAGIVAPSMLALVLTIAVLPVMKWARGRGWPGWLATLLGLAASYLILVIMVVGCVVCLVKFVEILPSYANQTADATKHVQNGLSDLGLRTSTTDDALSKIDPTKLAHTLAGVISALLGAVGFLFFLVTLMFFFVVAAPGFTPRIAALKRTKPELTAALGKFLQGCTVYLLITALFGAIVGVIDAGALYLLGVPLALAWGFFSFLTNFIPNVGFVIGIIPPAVLAGLENGWSGALAVVIVYSVINVTIQTFIQPRVVGNSVGLSAEVTFMSLVVWGFLLGALGALLAVPMTLLFRAIFIDSDRRAAWVAPLIDATVEQPPPEPAPPEPGPPEPAPQAVAAPATP